MAISRGKKIFLIIILIVVILFIALYLVSFSQFSRWRKDRCC